MDHAIIDAPEAIRRRRTGKKSAAAIAACLLCSFPAGAGPSACQRDLGATDIALIKSVLHLRGLAHAPEDQQCAAYRRHVSTVSNVRGVFERCLSGASRDADLRQLEGALDDANAAIARVCELSQNGRAGPSGPVGLP
jgi:hypothetical protein